MSLHILLLYATSEWLGILQFNIPYLVAQAHIEAISLLAPGGLRKTVKMKKAVSFKDPPFITNHPATLQSLSPSLQQQHEKDCEDSKLQKSSQGPFSYLTYPTTDSSTQLESAITAPRLQVAEVTPPHLSSGQHLNPITLIWLRWQYPLMWWPRT